MIVFISTAWTSSTDMSVNLRHNCIRGPFLDLLFITRVSNPLYPHCYYWKNLTEFLGGGLFCKALTNISLLIITWHFLSERTQEENNINFQLDLSWTLDLNGKSHPLFLVTKLRRAINGKAPPPLSQNPCFHVKHQIWGTVEGGREKVVHLNTSRILPWGFFNFSQTYTPFYKNL